MPFLFSKEIIIIAIFIATLLIILLLFCIYKLNNLSKKYQLEKQKLISEAEKKIALLEQKIEQRNKEINDYSEELNKQINALEKYGEQIVQLKLQNNELQTIINRNKEDIKSLTDIKNNLKLEFKELANNLLEEKSNKFTEQNKININELLTPVQKQFKDFQELITKTNEKNIEQHTLLNTQMKYLQETNKKLNEEAHALTTALKKNNKIQGNWGELILERILENSGLRENIEYIPQKAMRDDNNKMYRPDVVINLPKNKYIIIDSKMSLNDYAEYINLNNENRQEQAQNSLKKFLKSIDSHIKELSNKNYQNLIRQDKTLDFVFMFIPIELAFLLTIQHNNDNIIEYSNKNNIIITGPSTLLAMLKTINNVWQLEHQNNNSLEIAKTGGALYDKLVTFTNSLNTIGYKLQDAQKAHDDAIKQLSTGRGNLINRAEKLKSLGIKFEKQINEKLINNDD